MSGLTSDEFNENTDCVMVGHFYCDCGCGDPDICMFCEERREE